MGPRGSALICGYTNYHRLLESSLAELKSKEVLSFPLVNSSRLLFDLVNLLSWEIIYQGHNKAGACKVLGPHLFSILSFPSRIWEITWEFY